MRIDGSRPNLNSVMAKSALKVLAFQIEKSLAQSKGRFSSFARRHLRSEAETISLLKDKLACKFLFYSGRTPVV